MAAMQSFQALKEIHIIIKVPMEEILTLEFFVELAETLTCLKSVHILYLPLPPPHLLTNFAMKFSEMNILELLPQVQEILGEKDIVVSASER